MSLASWPYLAACVTPRDAKHALVSARAGYEAFEDTLFLLRRLFTWGCVLCPPPLHSPPPWRANVCVYHTWEILALPLCWELQAFLSWRLQPLVSQLGASCLCVGRHGNAGQLPSALATCGTFHLFRVGEWADGALAERSQHLVVSLHLPTHCDITKG